MLHVSRIIALMLCLLAGLLSAPAWAANTLLSSQKLTPMGNNLRLEIEFSQPMNFLSYFPKDRGKQLDIKMRPIVLTPGTNRTIKDELQLERRAENPVRDVSYEQDSEGNGQLSVQFTSEMQFTVEAGSDRNVIYINLINAARQTQTTSVDKNADSDLPIYVINLKTGAQPINADEQPVLKNFRPKYSIYTITSSDGRETLYQLRLGYFHSFKLASENVNRLKPFYPDAWVDRVTPQNRNAAVAWFSQQGGAPTHSTQNFRVKETVVATQPPATSTESSSSSAKAAVAIGAAVVAGAEAASSAATSALPSTASSSSATTASTESASPGTTANATGATSTATTTAAAAPATTAAGAAVAATAAATAATATSTTEKAAPTPSPETDTDSKLMTSAKQAMIDQDYRKANSYLNHILSDSNSTEHQEALELLGLSYERMGLPAQARAEYEKYLKEYPSGQDADRVKQRLTGLLTAKSAPMDKLKATSVGAEGSASKGWEFFGNFSQYYRFQQTSTDITATQTTDDSISSNLVLSGRKRGEVWDQRVDFSGSYIYNFLDQFNSGSNGTIYSLFYDLSEKSDDFSMRLGRQSHSSDGVLTRFDGVTLNKRIGLREKLSFLTGFPVDFTYSDSVQTSRYFYALSMKFESLLVTNLDTKFYFMHQTNDGLTDREAVGNETQYANKNATIYFMYDYDIFYNLTNLATFVGTWRTQDNSSINLSATYRNNPLMTTTNALIGQPVTTLDQLKQSFTEPQIQQLALDRTGVYRSVTASATKTLSKRFQVYGDMTVSSLSGTPASGGVPATQATGDLYYYNLQLIANNLLSSNDVAITGMRYYTDVGYTTTGIYFSDRFTLKNPKWRLNPRINIDWRSGNDGSSRTVFTPLLIAQWRPSRVWQVEMEFGYQYSTNSGQPNSQAFPAYNENDYYGYIGYSYNF